MQAAVQIAQHVVLFHANAETFTAILVTHVSGIQIHHSRRRRPEIRRPHQHQCLPGIRHQSRRRQTLQKDVTIVLDISAAGMM